MSDLFPNYTIDLEKGTVDVGRHYNRKPNKAGYYCCKIFDCYGNRYYYLHEIILAEGLNLPKHLWPLDEKGKRFQVDHIIPVSNGGTDSFDNLRLVSEKDNHNNENTRKNQSEARKGKHYSSSTEFKKGRTPWNKGLTYCFNR